MRTVGGRFEITLNARNGSVKTALLFVLLGGIAFTLASCGGEDCTSEMLQQKHRELQDAMTAALARNPAKAADNSQAWARALDLMAKAQSAGNSPPAEICKAYDEQIQAVTKQSS